MRIQSPTIEKDTRFDLFKELFHNHDDVRNICLNSLLCSGGFSKHSLALFVNAVNEPLNNFVPRNLFR